MGRRRRKGKKNRAPKPTKKLTDEVGGRIVEWAEEAVEAHDLELWEVVARPNWAIQVFVDRPGAIEPGKGVTIAECADVSRYVEAYLDADEDVWENYSIEVSSPGMDRSLDTERHYELSRGRDVRLVVHRPIEKRNVFEGELVEVDGDGVTVKCGPEDEVRIEWENIARARLTFDFAE